MAIALVLLGIALVVDGSPTACRHWWLIVSGAILLAGPALIEVVPESMAGIHWLEMVNGVEVERPEARYVVPVGTGQWRAHIGEPGDMKADIAFCVEHCHIVWSSQLPNLPVS